MSTVLEKAVLLDETGQLIVDKLDDIKEAIGNSGEFIPINIRVTTPPSKTNYVAGETLDLSGMVVNLVANNGGMYDVTGDCVFSPADGSTVTSSTTKVNISYTWYKDGTVFTAEQPLNILESIAITTPPTKTNYTKGEQLDLTGIVVKANFKDGSQTDITGQCAFTPSNGTILNTVGNINVLVQFVTDGQTFEAIQVITVSVKIVSWTNGTDAEIANMLQAHYDGDLDIHDYWSVGDERQIDLSAMPATYVNESHTATTATFVLMNVGGKTLEDGTTECAFVVGMKDILMPYGYMNSSNTNSGGWRDSARRSWCNEIFYNAISESIKGIFKQFLNKSGQGGGTSSGTYDTTDYFALPALVEVIGNVDPYAVVGEGTQFSYYLTTANRLKDKASTQEAGIWWLRSPRKSNSSEFCAIGSNGAATANMASYNNESGASPFGCI